MVLRVLLIALLVGLTPLASASPPDQSWLGGFFDDADYDDVVISVTSAVSAIESLAVHDIGPITQVVAWTTSQDEGAPVLPARSSTFSRAPPAV